MSDICMIKRLDGAPAIFLRFAGPDYVVIEVNRVERIVSRDFWADLPPQDVKSVAEPTVRLTG
jgi:hypothetical protein